MRIVVEVRPNSRIPGVEALGPSHVRVKVRAPAREGRANREVIELLSRYFDVPKTRVSLRSGATGRRKVYDVPDPQE